MKELRKTTKVDSLNKRNASIVKVLGACIFVCLVFCAGFFARGNTQLLDAMGFSSLEADSQENPGLTVSGNTYDSLSARVAEVEGILSQDSMDSYDLSKATTKVLTAFSESTEDSFLHYYDEQSYRAYLASTNNPQAGIGVLFGESDGSVFASDVFEDSAAAVAGVQAGDKIESIDGESKDSWTTPEVLDALSRDEGDTVYISWSRATASDGNKTYGTTLTFSSSSEDNVTWEVEGNVATIDVTQISADSATQVSQAIKKASDKGAQAFILDLRNVPGGYLSQSVDIASLFIQSGTVVQIKTVEGTTTRSADGKSVTDAPLVVLVNKRTAGCAEVLAAALQECGRAEVVGETTQGKGSIQVIQPLSFGGALRYTAAYYLTSEGRQIEGNGVSPNVETSKAKTQDAVALDLVRSKIS